jgi:TDG/mug DNA glycosylase family protein
MIYCQDRQLIGYQSIENWRGDSVLTLRDVWSEHLRAIIVGLNPAPLSVAAGHYYQGQTGQRQLGRPANAGIIARPSGRAFEEVAILAGLGFTDLVKRPTRGERDVGSTELEIGRRALREKLAMRDVPLVICVFRHPVKAMLGSDSAPGLQIRQTSWGADVFRMPDPFDAKDRASTVMDELASLLR